MSISGKRTSWISCRASSIPSRLAVERIWQRTRARLGSAPPRSVRRGNAVRKLLRDRRSDGQPSCGRLARGGRGRGRQSPRRAHPSDGAPRAPRAAGWVPQVRRGRRAGSDARAIGALAEKPGGGLAVPEVGVVEESRRVRHPISPRDCSRSRGFAFCRAGGRSARCSDRSGPGSSGRGRCIPHGNRRRPCCHRGSCERRPGGR